MLGPNPKKAATPSTATSNSSMSSNDISLSNGDGLMVKAIDDIFRHVESSENPQEFRVSSLTVKNHLSNLQSRVNLHNLYTFSLHKVARGKSLTTKKLFSWIQGTLKKDKS